MPLYTMPMCLVIGSTLWTLCSSYRMDFCFFSVARTTPLEAENKEYHNQYLHKSSQTNDRCSNQLHLCNLIMHSIKGRWWLLELLSQCPSGWPIDLTGQITHPFMIIKQYCRQKDKTIAWHYFSMLNQKTISHTALSTCCFQHYADYMKWL